MACETDIKFFVCSVLRYSLFANGQKVVNIYSSELGISKAI